MKEMFFPLNIYINNHPKGKISVFVDGEEISAYKNMYSCNIVASQEHKIVIRQVPKSRLVSIDGLTVFEKNYKSALKRKSVVKKGYIINKPIILCEWSADFKINKKADVFIEFYKEYYTNYFGVRNYYYLGKMHTYNGLRLKNIYSTINWSKKQKRLYYKLIHLKNSLLFFVLLFCFSYQIFEGFDVANEYIVASYTGYQYMIMSALFLLCSIIVYVYFSYKLYSEYKKGSIGDGSDNTGDGSVC